MGIKNIIAKAGNRAADKVARLAVLSPEQLKDMEARREQYLSQMPSSDDAAADELTKRLLAACSVEIYNLNSAKNYNEANDFRLNLP